MNDKRIDWKELAEHAWDSPGWGNAAREEAKHDPVRTDKKSGNVDIGPLARLLNDVHAFLGRFVIYPSKEAHDAHVLWIAHTHVMDAWESTPRIAFLSPEPASGKTRAIEVSELLVPNPVEAINVTPAYIFRKVGDQENGLPTILHDEIDALFGPKAKEHEDIRALYNAGHRRGAVVGRCVVHGKKVALEEISAFSALALAGLGWLPDTLLSRSVIIRMRRRASYEKITPFRRRVYTKEGNGLRAQLAAWAAGVVKDMTEARRPQRRCVGGANSHCRSGWRALAQARPRSGGNARNGCGRQRTKLRDTTVIRPARRLR